MHRTKKTLTRTRKPKLKRTTRVDPSKRKDIIYIDEKPITSYIGGRNGIKVNRIQELMTASYIANRKGYYEMRDKFEKELAGLQKQKLKRK